MPTSSRDKVIQWLTSIGETVNPESSGAEICARFVECASRCGFTCELVTAPGDAKREYEVRWSHCGSAFVGFKQAPPQATADDSLLAGCAALLANEWCCARLDSAVAVHSMTRASGGPDSGSA